MVDSSPWPRRIVAIMLFTAVLPLPYPYYMLLRVVVFIVFLSLAFKLYNKTKLMKIEMPTWGWALGAIGLLFNPIFPAFLIREVWMILDVAAGVFLLKTIKWEQKLLRHHSSLSDL